MDPRTSQDSIQGVGQPNPGSQETRQGIRESGLRTIRLEAAAVEGLIGMVDENFENAVQTIASCKGRLVISGIGKSAIIAQKIVATFNSTGTASLFLHAADAIHGDLGMIQRDDLVLMISRSGESPEIKVLVPLIKNFGNQLIAMVGRTDSYLAVESDIVLNTRVEQEACPNNLAPTSSTTAQLVMGDALAVALMEMKGFGSDDFAKFHPGGLLGKRLYMRVSDLFRRNEKPAVGPDDSLKKVIVEISRSRLGATAVTENDGLLLGVITDGDLRRMLEKDVPLDQVRARDIMTPDPKSIGADTLAVTAMELLRKHDITQLMVTSEKQYLGIIHLHDLVREGLI